MNKKKKEKKKTKNLGRRIMKVEYKKLLKSVVFARIAKFGQIKKTGSRILILGNLDSRLYWVFS